jgi:hypothetical protein
MCERDAMPSKSVACPDCGLVATMSTGDECITTMTYAATKWRKHC